MAFDSSPKVKPRGMPGTGQKLYVCACCVESIYTPDDTVGMRGEVAVCYDCSMGYRKRNSRHRCGAQPMAILPKEAEFYYAEWQLRDGVTKYTSRKYVIPPYEGISGDDARILEVVGRMAVNLGLTKV